MRWLSPPDLDVVSSNGQALENGIRVEMGGGTRVEKGDEGAVLVGQEPDGLDRPTSDMAQDLLGGGLRGDISQVDGATGGPGRGGGHDGGRWEADALAGETEDARDGRLRVHHLGRVTCGRGEEVVHLLRGERRLKGLGGRAARHLTLPRGGDGGKRRGRKGGRTTRLKGTAQQQLGGKEGGKLHIEGGSWRGHVGHAASSRPRVDRRHIRSTRVSVSEAGLVQIEGSMREPHVVVRSGGPPRRKMGHPSRTVPGGHALMRSIPRIHDDERCRRVTDDAVAPRRRTRRWRWATPECQSRR